jgi:hypothetical protein
VGGEAPRGWSGAAAGGSRRGLQSEAAAGGPRRGLQSGAAAGNERRAARRGLQSEAAAGGPRRGLQSGAAAADERESSEARLAVRGRGGRRAGEQRGAACNPRPRRPTSGRAARAVAVRGCGGRVAARPAIRGRGGQRTESSEARRGEPSGVTAGRGVAKGRGSRRRAACGAGRCRGNLRAASPCARRRSGRAAVVGAPPSECVSRYPPARRFRCSPVPGRGRSRRDPPGHVPCERGQPRCCSSRKPSVSTRPRSRVGHRSGDPSVADHCGSPLWSVTRSEGLGVGRIRRDGQVAAAGRSRVPMSGYRFQPWHPTDCEANGADDRSDGSGHLGRAPLVRTRGRRTGTARARDSRRVARRPDLRSAPGMDGLATATGAPRGRRSCGAAKPRRPSITGRLGSVSPKT